MLGCKHLEICTPRMQPVVQCELVICGACSNLGNTSSGYQPDKCHKSHTKHPLIEVTTISAKRVVKVEYKES